MLDNNLKSGSTKSCGCLRSELVSERLKGENNHKWDPNRTDEEREIGRNYPDYYQFRKKVYEKDNYTCVACGYSSGGNLVAHHLESYSRNHNLRTKPSNGVCLCSPCHKFFHVEYGFGNNTTEQFQEWIRRIMDE